MLFNYPNAHVPKKILLEQLYISPSYLEKLKRQLNKVLGRFQLQLVSRQNCYTITGNELFLRVFMYHFFSESFQGIQWPLKSLRYSSVKKEKLLSHELLTKTAIEKMIQQGMAFDQDEQGNWQFGLEGAHSSPRILHCHGDQTGKYLTRFAHEHLSQVEIKENQPVTRLLLGE
ncbi:helix-turn-helix domain-containing protein, partial [Enterococcus faecium]|uniref:helix-turn-helix domain-containing protein n=1 Tax=Enterococcus faecium TaxID=1352 RepID=UPI001D13873E